MTIRLFVPVLLITGWLLLGSPHKALSEDAAPQENTPKSGAVSTDAQAKPPSAVASNATLPSASGVTTTSPLPPSEPYPRLAVPSITWKSLEKGMELGTASIYESKVNKHDAMFVFLRISPEQNTFALQMASHEGRSYSLAEWSVRAELKAGINASMYLPDNITSTGYMRDRGMVNNAKLGGKLGAFFVSGRRQNNLPQAAIVERDEEGWREKINEYDLVVQNYRLVSSAGRILWPVGGPEHSIAAVASDEQGRIVFILCQEPLTAVRFAFYLRSFSLGLGTVMYVEGGAQAGIFVRVGDTEVMPLPGASAISTDNGTVYVWKGRQSMLNLRGNPHAALPNIIGVKTLGVVSK